MFLWTQFILNLCALVGQYQEKMHCRLLVKEKHARRRKLCKKIS